MTVNELLEHKSMTKYRLAKASGVPQTTVTDICSGKTRIEKCSAETLYKLAKALDVHMEELIAANMEYRQSFETFKSNICHMVKNMGDIDFMIDMLESDRIRKLYMKQWYPESLYLLAMVDYLSHENGLPLCEEYGDIRKARLREPIYPSSVIAMSAASRSDNPKHESARNAIPEFLMFNIIESEVRSVV